MGTMHINVRSKIRDITTKDKTAIGYERETTNASTRTNKNGIGYKLETTNASTSTTLEKTRTRKKNTSM